VTQIFLETGRDLARAWRDICYAIRRLDLRILTLKAFEVVLSPCLEGPLVSNETYRRQQEAFPLSEEDPQQVLSFQGFMSWVQTYELIMRDAGITGYTRDDGPSYGMASAFFIGDDQ